MFQFVFCFHYFFLRSPLLNSTWSPTFLRFKYLSPFVIFFRNPPAISVTMSSSYDFVLKPCLNMSFLLLFPFDQLFFRFSLLSVFYLLVFFSKFSYFFSVLFLFFSHFYHLLRKVLKHFTTCSSFLLSSQLSFSKSYTMNKNIIDSFNPLKGSKWRGFIILYKFKRIIKVIKTYYVTIKSYI